MSFDDMKRSEHGFFLAIFERRDIYEKPVLKNMVCPQE
jgi:hypothetical protein